MAYDIIFILGETFFDHPLCGTAILKRLLEKEGHTVGVIEMPQKEEEVTKLGKPKLFFGISSGSIDSMVRNYTPQKRLRKSDEKLGYKETKEKIPDRAVTVYCNWVRRCFKESKMVLGGTEASLRRFVHYDYWENRLRKPILFDSRADILVYGSGEKPIREIAARLKEGKELKGIAGTGIISKEVPENFVLLPSYEEVNNSKEKFGEMQNLFNNRRNLAQKIDNRYALQYKSPEYTTRDLDEYYELPFTRKVPAKHLRGFEFSVVTHRGCIGECNFCSLALTQGNKIVSRSEESILKEVEKITKLPYFKGNIDNLGGPSANMYGMDCEKSRECEGSCLKCRRLERSNKRLIELLQRVRMIKKVEKAYIKSGIRYDLASPEYLKEIARHHIFDTLRIAPEHVNKNVLKLMNKEQGELFEFVEKFKRIRVGRELSYYFMVGHPGCGLKEAEELAGAVKKLKNTEAVQVFTPTPMTVSTCMYYTGLNPKTGEKIYVPYTYSEKKKQKKIVLGETEERAGFNS